MITVLRPGLLTTIQDLGRIGFQKYGVIASGAMDSPACRIANFIVGNHENEAVIEITMLGPSLKFETDSLISICGADFAPSINGESVRLYRPIFVKKGSQLNFGTCQNGSRAYMAVAGGFNVPVVMKSKSTYLRAQIGGFYGRKLKSGDTLALQTPSHRIENLIRKLRAKIIGKPFLELNWSIGLNFIPKYTKQFSVRVMIGREFGLFTKESKNKLFQESYVITNKSDRMGYRLEGPPLSLETQTEMISEAVSFGTVQVPADGHPIVLLADRQTTGGYPKIAQIATVDLPEVAQAKPGDSISFIRISHEEAQLLYLKREHELRLLKKAIELKYS